MYYKEEIINGILCYKSTPNGEWKPLSQEALTDKIVKFREEIDSLKMEVNLLMYKE